MFGKCIADGFQLCIMKASSSQWDDPRSEVNHLYFPPESISLQHYVNAKQILIFDALFTW